VVSVHLPLSTETRHLISTRELSMMKPGALLVNTARGPIIDEDALIEALKSNKIRGAALDVFNHEPLAAGHPLRKLNNVLLTPHLGYVTEENYRMQFAQIVENIDAWLNGKPVRVITSSKDSHQ
jgi:phosphoglycerate dehydrogenase-like enzyme